MSERVKSRRNVNPIAALGCCAVLLTGCSIRVDSYLSDPSGVQCDGRRTKVQLLAGAMATFIVQGKDGKLGTIKVKRDGANVSVAVPDGISGPPQNYEPGTFSPPTAIVPGPELSAFAADGAWVIDAREDDAVVIQGTCEGM